MSVILRVASVLLLLLTCLVRAETITLEFAPQDPEDRISGNLIILLSREKFEPSRPGLLRAYLCDVRVEKGVNLKPGDRLKVELGTLNPSVKYVGAYLDENHNFMGSGLPEPGEYYSSKLLQRPNRDGALLRLDRPNSQRQRRVPAWIQEHSFVSSLLLDAGFPREEATVKFLVALPPGYWQSEARLPVLFVSHGFSGNRWSYLRRYRMWREQMKQEPMLLVSLDSAGKYGHHVFLDSQGNGPRLQVMTQEIVPYIDRYYRSNGTRIVYGQSSGGWTAVSLLRRAPEIFAGAVATGPDPLTLPPWWMAENENLYSNPDGSERTFAQGLKLTMRTFVERELETESYGQYAAFLAAFSPYDESIEPLPFQSPFHLESGALQSEVWKLWQDNDLNLWAQSNPSEAKKCFADRLILYVGDKDEFGLFETTQAFSETLLKLEIPHAFRVVPGAGHTNYLERPAFAKELWSACYDLAQERKI